MIYLAIDKDGKAHLFRIKPYRDGEQWKCNSTKDIPFPVLPVELSAVSMWLNKTNLTWQDEPIEIYTELYEKMVSLEQVCEQLKNTIYDDVLVKCGSVIKCMDVDDFVLYFRKTIGE